jgi:hypothetical protein
MTIEIAALYSRPGSGLDQSTVAPGIFSLAAVAEATLIQMHERDAAHSIT